MIEFMKRQARVAETRCVLLDVTFAYASFDQKSQAAAGSSCFDLFVGRFFKCSVKHA